MKEIKKIAIIPARGGSKRILGKNSKDFLGKPIIAYSIQAALQSNLFDEVMVSTDDEKIAKIAKQYGASVPFFRSFENSDDFSTLADVLLEVIESYNKVDVKIDNICCILPTAPFVTNGKLINSWNAFTDNKYESLYPVVEFSFPIQRSLVKDELGLIKMANPEHLKTRSQDLEKHYHDAGQFYWIKTSSLQENNSLMTKKTGMFELTNLEVQDIDTPEDWLNAELKYRMLNE